MPKHWEWLIEDSRETIKSGQLAKYLDIVATPLASTQLPKLLAERCCGNAGVVYDVTARLTAPGMYDIGAALDGSSPGFAQPGGLTLAKFIESRGSGVIVFDDLQAFATRAIETLAEIADSGFARKEGTATRSISASRFIILATARLPIPSPNELMRRANRTSLWEPDARPPESFRRVIEELAREHYPDHFQPWLVGRFEGIDAGFVWERYCDLLAQDHLDESVFGEPVGEAVAAMPPRPAVRDFVPDLSAIKQLVETDGPFDVFISYSWSRTAEDAGWLRTELKNRGLRVFFDKDDLNVSAVPDEQIKTVLIQRLSAIVQNSRAWIVFAADLRPFALESELSQEKALKRGLAMEVNGTLVEWSWQTLELRYMGRRLVIGQRAAYILKEDGTWDSSYGQRIIEGREDILNYAIGYLSDCGIIPSE